MPQLPSGRHVVVAADPVIEKFSKPIEFGFARWILALADPPVPAFRSWDAVKR